MRYIIAAKYQIFNFKNIIDKYEVCPKNNSFFLFLLGNLQKIGPYLLQSTVLVFLYKTVLKSFICNVLQYLRQFSLNITNGFLNCVFLALMFILGIRKNNRKPG